MTIPVEGRLKIVDPSSGRVLQQVEADTAATIAEKLDAARVAQRAWREIELDERRAAIRRFGVQLETQKDRLAGILTAEMGKPLAHARNELNGMAERIAFFVDAVGPAIADEVVLRQAGADGEPALEERIAYEPLGVVASISAWNYPYFVGSNVFVPALLTGNAVLYKPSEHATLTGLAIAALLHEAGVPPGAFATVVGGGDVGALLVEQPVDAVFFTGSNETGRHIATAAAPRLLRVQLELGGKDPLYVCDDVDVAAAAALAVEGAFYNAGQSCCAVERIYVQHGIADAFTTAFVDGVRALRVGDPRAADTYIGPLAREPQLAVLAAHVNDAVRRGGRLLCGGRRLAGSGFFFEPTVVADADHRMLLMREESFGPVIGIQTVADDAEAVTLMNDTQYGLTAAVFSADRARAERILAAVDAGTTYWNCCDRVSPRLPWTGRRGSGLGVTLSVAGIRACVQPKAWHLREP
jgi:acyl-CoA reductase-like NAD-dependent aldehyde dehydrogenase